MRFAGWMGLSLVLACGGTAVIDGGQGGDAGGGGVGASGAGASGAGASGAGASGAGATGQGGGAAGPSGPNTSVGVSSGPGPSCNTLTECCGVLCQAISQLPCFHGNCECDEPAADGCKQPLLAFEQCVAANLPGAIACDGMDVKLKCGVCADALAAIPPGCGVDTDCVP